MQPPRSRSAQPWRFHHGRLCRVLQGLGALVVALSLLSAAARAQMKLEDYEVGNYEIGGDFTLIDHNGEKTRLSEFKGKVVLMSFGYTSCPDVCPVMLAKIVQVKKALGAKGEKLQALFVTVDPDRDTPQRLKRYMEHFDPTFVGLTGSREQIDKVATQYVAKYRPGKGNTAAKPLLDHTSFSYMIDQRGKLRYLFTHDAKREPMIEGVIRLLAAQS